MNASLFWKSLVFWLVVLAALVIATTLIPGSDKWSEWASFPIVLAIAFVQPWYFKRKWRADPEAFKTSPRARRNWLIASLALFSLLAVDEFLRAHGDSWTIAVGLLCGVAAMTCAYRLFNELRLPPKEAS